MIKTISHVKLENERRKPILKKRLWTCVFVHCSGEIIAAWCAWRWWYSTCKKTTNRSSVHKRLRVLSCALWVPCLKKNASPRVETIFCARFLVIASCPFSSTSSTWTQLPKNQFFCPGGVSRAALRSRSSSGWDYIASFAFLIYMIFSQYCKIVSFMYMGDVRIY